MTDRSKKRLAWGLFLGSLAALIASTVMDLADARPGQWSPAMLTQPVAFLAIGLAGLAIARRQPGNAIGWIYLCVWVGVAFMFGATSSYAYWATVHRAAGATFATWLGNWIWVPIFATLLTYPFLLFPDGHLPSRRWRAVPWAAGIVTALWSVSFALENQDYTDILNRSVPNPYTLHGLVPIFDAGRVLFAFGIIAIMGFCIASLIVRFRRSGGDEREQIKWVIFAGSVLLVWIALPLDRGTGGPADAVQGFVIALVPASIGLAIVKYRLYDIDVVIKKTVVYAVLAAMLLAVGALVVVIVGGIVVGPLSQNGAALIAAGAVMGFAIWPLRRLATTIADRVVFGGRTTPYEVLAKFSSRIGGSYQTDDVLPRMARILAEGTGATRASVWLTVGTELRLAASWPAGSEAARLPDGTVPVRFQGDELGALCVEMPANDPMTDAKRGLVEDLASQAGPVLRNVRLIEELKASRQRLVAAQDEERRRLERNIHDGAQQQLVALSVKQRLAASLIGKDDERARSMLEDLQTQTNEALEDLRDLARGIYPPLLADKGLAAALEAQARKAAVPTTVHADGAVRYDQDVEASVYFCALEALQNIAKYANATRATIRLARSNGMLTFDVQDDGDGFDTAATTYGTGIQGMVDRLDAVGGSLVVRSEPGRGTKVSGSVPAEGHAP